MLTEYGHFTPFTVVTEFPDSHEYINVNRPRDTDRAGHTDHHAAITTIYYQPPTHIVEYNSHFTRHANYAIALMVTPSRHLRYGRAFVYHCLLPRQSISFTPFAAITPLPLLESGIRRLESIRHCLVHTRLRRALRHR